MPRGYPRPLPRLQKLRAHADPLPAETSRRPSSGWLIQGVFYALDENSRLISVPFVQTDKGPNVEVSVTVTDYALNSDVPARPRQAERDLEPLMTVRYET